MTEVGGANGGVTHRIGRCGGPNTGDHDQARAAGVRAQRHRLIVEALRERQERELITSPDFGLLHNTDPGQLVRAGHRPPDPDELLCPRKRDGPQGRSPTWTTRAAA